MSNDGGPAFPNDYPNTGDNGMSLRDWFAGQALIGLLKEPGNYSWRAAECYRQADAMLTAREGKVK